MYSLPLPVAGLGPAFVEFAGAVAGVQVPVCPSLLLMALGPCMC